MQNLFEFIVKNKLTSKYTDNGVCVDLDLPSGTLWATCNIGASKPEEYGGYYQWGGLEDMSNKSCDWSTAPFNGGNTSFNKNTWDKYKNKVLDSNNNLKLEYDVAYKESNCMLRIPTKDELKELIEHTNNEWCEINGVKGRKFISKKDDSKWIFIPANGYYNEDNYRHYNIYGYYWSATMSLLYYGESYRLRIFRNKKQVNPLSVYRGFGIRGVQI